ncbi:MAG: hypothetical protein ACPL7O_04260 [Armatimonadota bacterium]
MVLSENCLDASLQPIVNLVLGKHPSTNRMMPGWDIEIARQKLLFFTTPEEFPGRLEQAVFALDDAFNGGDAVIQTRCIDFMLGIADSLNSIVELKHNLQNVELHGDAVLADDVLARCRTLASSKVCEWENLSPEAARTVLESVKREDMAVNKGDNLFIAWAESWKTEKGVDPYGSVGEFLECFAALYKPDTYYVSLFLAWQNGETRTQFFNDYGLQAARCRKIGSLGGTTNPAIAVMGEDDLDGKGNIHGEFASDFIKSVPNKWRELRKEIAKEQLKAGRQDDWAATVFTEWVVVDAMLGLRSVFLLHGLGRVAFQLRPDWHDDEEKLAYAGGEIYDHLADAVKVFDDILLEGANDRYSKVVRSRVGKPNNHFKISCTGQTALNIVRAFNAGYHPLYTDAVKERMFTNMTLSYDVSQIVATWLAIEEGIAEYERRTGEEVNDGKGGSVITSMIGRFNDAIRAYRVQKLLDALPAESKFKSEINPSAVRSLNAPPFTSQDFLSQIAEAGIEFDPAAEEDAIDRAGTLVTKRAVMHIEGKYNTKRSRVLTASKRNFFQNTELLGVPFSTDFGNIQREFLDRKKAGTLEFDSWCTIYDGMNPDGTPAAGSIWDKRHRTLLRIWPDWAKAFDPEGVKPHEYISMIYVPPTLNQFLGFWAENISRAKEARELVESGS